MKQEDRTVLNGYYVPLEQRRRQMQAALAAEFPITMGWFNGHYRRDEAGEYGMDCFPIPEITVTGLCDVELHFDMVNVTTKLRREDALNNDFIPFTDVPFEAYGVQNYLLDFRTEGVSIDAMYDNIRNSDEQEVFFTFSLAAEVTTDTVTAFVQRLRNSGFYY